MQKESLGEYGSGWEWDSDWPYVFDNEKLSSATDEIGNVSGGYYPTRYVNTVSKSKPSVNGTWVDYSTGISSTASSTRCPVESTNGELLISGNVMQNAISCKSHVYNAGNYYNYPSTAPDSNKLDSVCPKGWKLPENGGKTSYSSFLLTYGIDFNSTNMVSPYDASLLNLPLSFLRTGYFFNGVPGGQDRYGYYRTESYSLYFSSVILAPIASAYTDNGFPVRCVSR